MPKACSCTGSTNNYICRVLLRYIALIFSLFPLMDTHILEAQRVVPPKELPIPEVTIDVSVHGRPECVVLLHGLVRTPRCMKKMVRFLEAEGYDVYNVGYPSNRLPVEELTPLVFDALSKQLGQRIYNKIHFIVHSLGSVIVRQFLKENEFNALGRIVMLAPPSQGSEVVDRLGGIFLYKWINGPAGLQLGTGPDSLPNRLGPVNFECGVLAGRKTINLYLSTLFPGENDGKVSVERAKLEGMKDFRVLDVAHPFIMQNREAMRLSLNFLREGRFGSEISSKPES